MLDRYDKIYQIKEVQKINSVIAPLIKKSVQNRKAKL